MRTQSLDDIDSLLDPNRRPTWSDFERMWDLRELIAATDGRVEQLPGQTMANADDIAWERALLYSTQEELRKLEARLFMI